MVIEKINIKSFGALTDTAMDFSEKLNVVEGPNESGKSTVAAFIRYMLYGFDNSDMGATLTERKRRINWKTGMAQGSMIVRVKGKRYLINRSTVLSEGGGEKYREDSSIVDLESGAPCFGKTPAGEVFFGVDREVFENTAFIEQFSDSRIGENEMKEAIENILFSGSEKINTQRAANKLQAKMETLLHEHETGGAIFDLNRRAAELNDRLGRAQADNREILDMTAKVYELRRSREESTERERKLYDLDACYKNVVLIQTFDKLHETERLNDEAAEKCRAWEEENRKDGFVPDAQYLTDLAVSRRVVNDSYKKYTETKEAAEKLRESSALTAQAQSRMLLASAMGGDEKLFERAQKVRRRGVLFTALTAVGAFVGLALAITAMFAPAAEWLTALLYGAAAVFGAGAIAFGALLIVNRREGAAMRSRFGVTSDEELVEQIAVIREARIAHEATLEEARRAEAAFEKAKGDYENAKAELCSVIIKWGRTPPASDINAFLDNLEADVKEFLLRLSRLEEEKSSIELAVGELRRRLAGKNEVDIRAQVSPLKRKALSEVNYEEITDGIAACRSQTSDYEKQVEDLEMSLSGIKARAEDPADIACRIAAVNERIEELHARHTAYEVALKSIEGAGERLRSEISPRLAAFSRKLIKIMTRDKYSEVDVNSALKIMFSGSGECRSAEYLSGGTQDLAYISLRMALIDLLYREAPPVCFDESFSHQDNMRARATMSALLFLSEQGQQNFVFTCRARESALAAELDKSTAVFRLPLGSERLTAE